jgi:hypothetical protein
VDQSSERRLGPPPPHPHPGCTRDGYHEDSPVSAATIIDLHTPALPACPVTPSPLPYLQHAAAMNPYQRPSPRTASPASNLQTNPTRTNNQRHSSDRNSYFDTPPYSDRGAEEGDDDMVSRGDHMAETDQRQYQKINQVIQVRTAACYREGSKLTIHRTSLRNRP